MFNLRRQKLDAVMSVLFRGTLAPRAEEFSFLTKRGITIEPLKVSTDAHWGLTLTHPLWGMARLIALRDVPPLPRMFIDHAIGLTDDEKETALAAGTSVAVGMGETDPLDLAGRKQLLRFASAVMGDDGVGAIDEQCSHVWTRRKFDEELAHDADLDISAIFTMHGVRVGEGGESDDRICWLHSHGLAEAGAFDFDILWPSQEAMDAGGDFERAVAFAILEGAAPNEPAVQIAQPRGEVRFVPVETFHRRADHVFTVARDLDENHSTDRVVLCDCKAGLFGFGKKVRPASLFIGPVKGVVVLFSADATELMAARAKGTLAVLASLKEEFAEFEFPIIAKIGYETDNGNGVGKEHLWFAVDKIGKETLNATLENDPHDIASLKRGDRGEHPIERLTDWAIVTPAGAITPRSFTPVWEIRANLDLMREHMAELKE